MLRWATPRHQVIGRIEDRSRLPHPREVSHTPISVTARPMNIAGLSGSENSIQAHSMVTGGLR